MYMYRVVKKMVEHTCPSEHNKATFSTADNGAVSIAYEGGNGGRSVEML